MRTRLERIVDWTLLALIASAVFLCTAMPLVGIYSQ